jgi:two-component system cell cycle sensor histidine kinase/response regulator CckA
MNNLQEIAPELTNFQGPKVKVLAVDDEPKNLLVLQLMLEAMPLELIQAHSGEEALRHLLDHDVALILMDVQMPHLDGFETASIIRTRERTRHIPIVFLTAGNKYDAHMKGYALGAVDYLLKPLVPEILMAKVAVFVELFRRAEQIRIQEKMLRERAEEALVATNANYRLLFENNPLPMWVYDADTLAFLAVNDAAIEKYGYPKPQFLKMTIRDLSPAEDLPSLFESVSRTQQTADHAGTWRHQKRDGTVIDVEVASHKLPFAGRNARLVVVNDITEKKRIEAQLLRTQRMESIGTLAGGIAHDLNNVLAPILLGLQVMKDKFKDESSRRLMDTMETSAKRGKNIVRQVLTFARGLEGEQVVIQLKHLLANMEKMLRQTLPKSVDVELEIPQRLWTIHGDPTQVDQVLLNLCVNARDAMPDGGKLSIRAENMVLDETYARLNLQAKPGRYVVIEVADTGHGMAPKVMDKIFEPFFTTKEVGKGTGLGLSTVQAIVKSHGGFLNVYSEIGKGTSFKVYFPVKESSDGHEAVVDQMELPLGHGELILIVDDEAAVREIAQVTLESYNYRVVTAKDGAEAVACYAQQKDRIDAVLLDMMMPIMDGPATIRALETINPRVRIVAASGLVDSAKNPRVSAVLAKPYTAEKLLRTLSSVLGAN